MLNAVVCAGDVQTLCPTSGGGCTQSTLAEGDSSPPGVCACGAYDVLFTHGIDSSDSWYFAHTTGKLVAVIDDGPPEGATCVGPASFTAPVDCTWPSCEADAGEGDAGLAPAAASAPACGQSLAVGCMSQNFGNCSPTWNAANVFCVAHAGNFGYAQTDCGAYLRWHVENVDVGCSYYYDKTNDDLVAVFCTDFMGNTSCLGGPADFTEPPCGVPVYQPCVPSDSGNDRGDAATTD